MPLCASTTSSNIITLGSASQTGSAQIIGSASSSQEAVLLDASSPDQWRPSGIPLLKHIPKAGRPACATHLANALRDVAKHPLQPSYWVNLFNWGNVALHLPKRGGKRHNLAAIIKKRLADFQGEVTEATNNQYPVDRRNGTPDDQMAHAVAAKLEEGNISAAIRILVSEGKPSTPSLEGLHALQEKHPPASGKIDDLPSPPRSGFLEVSEDDVRKAISSFPAGSSGGPDGIRPQHIKDLIQCQEAGADLLSALTLFTNTVLEGRCPPDIATIFFGGRLIALTKKSGGLRPIVVGMTLRRLASKCASAFGIAQSSSYFSPIQLGVGIRGGAEAAVHSARRFTESLPHGHVVVKLDFSNAFNCLHRSDMLLAIRDRLPKIYAFCYSAYSQPSKLFFGDYTVQSQEGPQQGDPLGPLLFCNTLHPLLQSLKSELNLGYLDDLTLGGLQSQVADDVRHITSFGENIGLHLNVSKCELICAPDLSIENDVLKSFQRLQIDEACLLGIPLSQGPSMDKAWTDRLEELTKAVQRMNLIGTQDALILLRASFGLPRVQHLLRCSPSIDHPLLEKFDRVLRSAIDNITNSSLSDNQWLQASSPIREGGLGVRRVAALALPAFIASAASTLELQNSILLRSTSHPDSVLETYLTKWSSLFGPIDSDQPLSAKQSFWDHPGIIQIRSNVEANLIDSHQKASFLAACSPHTGDWLLALPIASCGLRLDNEAVRIAVALRLGMNVCVPHTCRCGSQVDASGSHGLVCKRAAGRIARHQCLNDIIARAFTATGTPITKEPNGLSRSDGKRPDGLTLVPWAQGKPLTWDVTVICTSAASYIASSSRTAGSAAELAAARKEDKYSCLSTTHIFKPLAFETLGPMNASADTLVCDLGRRTTAKTNDTRETSFLFQRISLNIQRFNSVLIHESFITADDQDQ